MRISTIAKRTYLLLFLVCAFFGMQSAFAQCPTVSNPNQSFCDIQSPTIASLSATNNGGGVVWYATATSTTPLSPSAGLVNGEDYFVDSTAGGCSPRPAVIVTIYGPPSGLNFQGVCVDQASNATISDLQATGNNVQWYVSPSSMTPLAPSTILNDNTIYYASQTNPNTGCQTSRLSVFVNVGVVPVPVGAAVQQFCFNPSSPATVANLQPSGSGYNWYATESSAVALPLNTPLVNGESYFATTVDPPCESINRLEVTVELVDPNDAGDNGTVNLCENQLSSTPPLNLFNFLGGSPDATGAWSGPVMTTNGNLGTLDVSLLTVSGSPYVFTYTVNSSLCPSDSATVTVTVTPPPTAVVSGTTTICSGNTATVTFTGTPNSIVTYNVNGGPNQTISLNASGVATITGTYTATTVYNLVSASLSGPAGCSQALTGSITVTVLPLPVATIASNVSICSGDPAVVTITGTANATVQYSVNGGPAQSIVLDASGVATITGNYTANTTISLLNITSAGSPSCVQPLNASVTITVIVPPVVTISGSASVCPGGSATVTFTGTANAVVHYTVNGGAVQSITLNASGTASITTTYSATTVYNLIDVTTAGTPSCTQPASGSVTVTVLPLPSATIAASQTVCSGGSATVTFTGTPNATVTYTVNGGPNQTIVLNAAGIATLTNTYVSSSTISLVSISSAGSPSCSQPLTGSVLISVSPPPTVTIASSQTICSGDTATITFTGTANASVTYTVNGSSQTIVLDGSGTATVTGVYTTTTNFVLVSAATSGTPSCSQPQTGSATITVIPPPAASISTSTTICSGDSATISFTGTANATVTYTVNGGPNQTITLNASGTASITGTYTATTTYTLVSVTSAGATTCTAAVSGTVVITVLELPVVTITSDVTICPGDVATVTFTGTPTATATYTVNGGPNQTIVLNASGTATITQAYATTTVYTLLSVSTTGSPGCSQPQSGTVTIEVVDPPTVSIAADSVICPGDSATVTFTGTANATVHYTVNGGPIQTIVLNASGNAVVSGSYMVTTVFQLVDVVSAGTPGCTQPASGSATITVNTPPSASIAADVTVCTNDTATVTFTGTPNATVTYTVNGGPNQSIVLDASGTAAITQAYSATTIYHLVSVTNAGTPACSQNLDATVTVTVQDPPTVTIASDDTVCPGDVATVTFTGTPNAVVTFTINSGSPQTIALDASGSASFTQPYSVTSTIELVSAAVSGCSQAQTGTVVITVLPTPTVNIAANVSVCSGDSATITFTGTANAIVTYTVNGGPNQTIALDASGTATITTTYTATTTYELVSVSFSGAEACPQDISGSVTVTVVALPVAMFQVVGDTGICSGDSVQLIFTGTPDAVVSYTINAGPVQTILLDATGSAVLDQTLIANAIYTLTHVAIGGSSGCGQDLDESVTITVTPAPNAGNDVASLNLCVDSPSQDLFLLLGPDAQTGGIWSPSLASGSGVFDPSVDPSGIYTYTVSGNSPCPDDTASVNVIVLTPPNAGNDALLSLCTNDAAQDLFLLLGASAQAGGSWSPALASGTGVFDPSADAAGAYTYTLSGAAVCPDDSATVTVTLIDGPDAGSDGAVTYCISSGQQDLFDALNGTPESGGSWSPALASGSGIFDPLLDPAGAYTYTVNGNASCPEASATVTVAVVTEVDAGNDAVLNTCSNDDAQDLFALLGPDAQIGGSWSPTLASGSGIFDPAVDPAGNYTYTVNGFAPCVDDSAVVSVTVTPGPDAGLDGNLTLCANSAAQDLFASLNGTPQPGGNWSPALASGTGVFDPLVDAAGVYTYTFTGSQPCDNDSATVTVVVNPVPDAGSDGSTIFCTNSAPADLFSFLGGTPQTGGTWSPALTGGNGIFDPLADASGVYTYTVGGGFCPTDTATVTVTVVPSPVAGADGALTVCVSSTSVDLTTGLDGSQSAGIFTDDDATGALNGNLFNPSAVAAGVYHFTYTVSGGQSPCTTDTAVVTVTVEPQPQPGTFTGEQSVCVSGGNFDLFNLLSGNDGGGVWTDMSGNAQPNPVDVAILGAGTFSFTYTVTNSCGSDSETVTLTVNPDPLFDNSNFTLQSPVCAGQDLLIVFNGMADGSYTLLYDLSGANAATNSTGLLTVVGGTGNFVVPGISIANTGTTTVTFSNILDNATNCTSNLSNVLVAFEVNPLPSFDNAALSASSVCFGSDVTVTLSSASAIADGNYIFNYTIAGLTPPNGNSGVVAVNSGAASFVFAASLFTVAGNYTITLDGIVGQGDLCGNMSTSLSADFNLTPVPDLDNALLVAGDVCLGYFNTVFLTGAVDLPDGSYTISYQLSGANTATNTAALTVTNGDGMFGIPASELTQTGSVTLTVTGIDLGSALCTSDVSVLAPVVFSVLVQPGTPSLIEQGDGFCGRDNPTIADLSANIAGGQAVIWYDAATGGTAYAPTDLLVDGTTYYAEFAATNCEGAIRLQVTVDLTVCVDLLIPDGFSPNGDGINDDFDIVNIRELYPKFKLEIYNRYGNILFKGNASTDNWNGTATEGGIKMGDGVLPTGVYFFVLEFNDGIRKPLQGRIYLNR